MPRYKVTVTLIFTEEVDARSSEEAEKVGQRQISNHIVESVKKDMKITPQEVRVKHKRVDDLPEKGNNDSK